jgi:glycosidase
MTERRLTDIDWQDLRNKKFNPSPAAWEDQVLYFLMCDRFSDGNEEGFRAEGATGEATPLYRLEDAGNAVQNEADAREWREAGARWVGGTLRGLRSKLGYLKDLGITAVWVSPVLKQVEFQDTYHGYGIQNFLDVDPHFGTREDLRELIRAAHEHGIYVILDVILNHTGNVFAYDADRYRAVREGSEEEYFDPRWDGNPYKVLGFHDEQGVPRLPFRRLTPPDSDDAWPKGAVWPEEFQNTTVYTQKGRISGWDHYPEYLEGDFYDLKDIRLGVGDLDNFRPSAALLALCQVYKFWIAYADLDGFRVDTVKHMEPGATRFFTAVIHEFAQSLGKENFYLIGEITGGRGRAFQTLEETGLDAALGISDEAAKLEGLVKGHVNPEEYFDLFRNSLLLRKESHVWFRNKVVTVLDDHDQVRQGNDKARFCAHDLAFSRLILCAVALQTTTLGIPCIYYGTEQCFDGAGGNDRYIREAMFGGSFGAFRSRGRHFFNDQALVYRQLKEILSLRKQHIALRRGRQYLREISGDGSAFGFPRVVRNRMRSIVPWSRLFTDQEVLLAINTDAESPTTAWVIVDNDLHALGDHLTCLYSTTAEEVGTSIEVQDVKDGSAKAVRLTVPSAGFVIYTQLKNSVRN